MKEKPTSEQIDRVLIPFLQADDESDSEKLLASLIVEQAEPLIKEIITRAWCSV
jgi:hypothetical protein